MKAAIFFSGQYGSTEQYANWISEATGLPVFDVNDTKADPADYDVLILGSSIIVFKLTLRKWISKHLATLINKKVILFTVSGAPAGPKLDGWVKDCLPEVFTSNMQHVALQGRMNPKAVSWWDRMVLMIGAWKNDDPEAKKQELQGFDFMDKSGIDPIVKRIQQYQSGTTN